MLTREGRNKYENKLQHSRVWQRSDYSFQHKHKGMFILKINLYDKKSFLNVFTGVSQKPALSSIKD